MEFIYKTLNCFISEFFSFGADVSVNGNILIINSFEISLNKSQDPTLQALPQTLALVTTCEVTISENLPRVHIVPPQACTSSTNLKE